MNDDTLKALSTDDLRRAALISVVRKKHHHSGRWALGVAITSLVVSLICGAFTGFAAWQERRQADSAEEQTKLALSTMAGELQRAADERARFAIENWQTTEIHRIIDMESGKSLDACVSFDDIKTRYIQAAGTADLSIPKANDDTLRHIIYGLIQTGIVLRTHDGRFGVQRSELTFKFGRNVLQESASLYILSLLEADKGKYTADSMKDLVIEHSKISKDEYIFCVANLVKDRWVMPDDDGKLFLPAFPPPKK